MSVSIIEPAAMSTPQRAQISISLPVRLQRKIDRMARKDRRTRSGMMRVMLAEIVTSKRQLAA